MNERIKKIRIHLGFSQKEFAEKLGLTQSGVSWMEQQGKTVSDQNIRLICTLFNVDESWLRTGEGEMHVQTDSVLIEELATEYKMSEKQKKIIATFAAMDEKKREVLAEAFFEFVDALASSPDVSATIATRPAANDTKLTVEQKRHIVMNELPNEEKGQISSVSIGGNGTNAKLA